MPDPKSPETPEVDSTATAEEIARDPQTIKQLLQGPQLKTVVAQVLPKHLTADRFLRVAINALTRNPKLLECTRESFFKCLLDLSMYGLEPDGRRAHLIPFNNKIKTPGKPDRWQMEVQLIVDYKGLAELVRRSGEVSYIHADVVKEGDKFDFSYGTNAFLKHVPKLEKRGEKIIAFYSFVKLKDETEDFVVMSYDEVEKIRARSKAKDNGPWITDYDEMGKKTAFRRQSKWLPFSSEIKRVVEADDHITGEIDLDALDAGEILQLPEGGSRTDQMSSVKDTIEKLKSEGKVSEVKSEGDATKSERPSPREQRAKDIAAYFDRIGQVKFDHILAKHNLTYEMVLEAPDEQYLELIGDLEEALKESRGPQAVPETRGLKKAAPKGEQERLSLK